MRVTRYSLVLAICIPATCFAQQWELGAVGGYGWYANPSITDASGTGNAGFSARSAVGVVAGNNMYEYVGGELRYLYRFGGPMVQSGSTRTTMSGYTNVVTYDVIFHLASRDSNFRRFVAGGGGIKVYTGDGNPAAGQPPGSQAILTPATQVKPAISAGAGIKYRLARHALLRIELRTYMTPLPDQIFQTTGQSRISGWVFDTVPTVGLSYVF